MTVNYLQNLRVNQPTFHVNPGVQYISGFQDCAHEAVKYLSERSRLNPEVTSDLHNHLLESKDRIGHGLGTVSGSQFTRIDIENGRLAPGYNYSENIPILTSTPKQTIVDLNWTLVEQNYLINNMHMPAVGDFKDSKYNNEAENIPKASRKLFDSVRSHGNQLSEDPPSEGEVWRPW